MNFEKITQGAHDYGSPFLGPVLYTVGINVAISGMSTAEVDANGVLKPGVPLQRAGTLVSAVSQTVWGCVAEAKKVAKTNATADLTAAGTKEVPVVLIGAINRDILEDILGRALTANEVAAFGPQQGSLIRLVD